MNSLNKKMIRPKEAENRNKVRELTFAAMFVALIAVGAFLSVPIGAVSMTMQTFSVMLAGLMLSRRNALLSVIAYLLLGLAGLPIFAGGVGGMAILVKPGVGFLIGFIPLALLAGFGKDKNTKEKTAYLVLGNVVLYLIGFAYMIYYFNHFSTQPMGIVKLLQVGVLPYLPGDMLKIGLAVMVSKYLKFKV